MTRDKPLLSHNHFSQKLILNFKDEIFPKVPENMEIFEENVSENLEISEENVSENLEISEDNVSENSEISEDNAPENEREEDYTACLMFIIEFW